MGQLLLLVIILHTATSQQGDISQCPSNIQRGSNVKIFQEHCYEFLIHRHQDWNHAKTDCVLKGGHLVTIRNSETQNFIVSTLKELYFQGKGVWIGLNDINNEGHFVWESNEPVSYTYWSPGEPGNIVNILPIHHEEDCVLLKTSDSGHWHDYPCTGILFILPENDAWICEYDVTPLDKFVNETVIVG